MKIKGNETLKAILIVIIALFITIGLNIDLNKDITLEYSLTGNSVLCILQFVFAYWLIRKAIQIKDRRLTIIAAIIGILFACFKIVGFSIHHYMNLEAISGGIHTLEKSILSWLSYFIVIFCLVKIAYDFLKNRKIKISKEYSFFTANKRSLFLIWGVIFIVWIPFLLRCFPGVTTVDSIRQIQQVLGVIPMATHHPVVHSWLIGFILQIGKIFGSYTVGVAIYSVLQMLVLSGIFSFTVYYMAKRKVSLSVRILSFLFFALYPVHGFYSVTMWKDIPFAISMLIFTIMMTELALNEEHFMKSKLKVVLFTISVLLIILFRNNGIYVYALMIPVLLILVKTSRKKIILISAIGLITYGIMQGPILSIFHINKGSTGEALSIPLQQFARITKYHSDTLTEEEKQRIYKYLPVDNLADLYNPILSDPVKAHFNHREFHNHNQIDFVKLWVKLCLKYPRAAVESFLCNNYGYWYPEAVNWVIAKDSYLPEALKQDGIDINQTPIILENSIVDQYGDLITKRTMPVLSLIFSLGFIFWIVIFFTMYAIYKKDYKKLLIYLPIVFLWLTTIASPVYCEFRYLYSMIVCIPLLIAVHFYKEENAK